MAVGGNVVAAGDVVLGVKVAGAGLNGSAGLKTDSGFYEEIFRIFLCFYYIFIIYLF